VSDEFFRKGLSLTEMYEREMKAKKRAAESNPESVSMHFTLDRCPECDASATSKEIGGYPVGISAKRSTPDSNGLITVTCRVCDHIWLEDQMVHTMIKSTSLN
jgi:hypothetical protein